MIASIQSQGISIVKINPPTRILVAVRPDLIDIAQNILAPEFSLCFCHTLDDAEHLLLTQKFDLIVSTLRFDGSQMFELLKDLKSHAVTRNIPFFAVVLECSLLPDEAVDHLLKAAELMGANEEVNLPQWRRALGDEAAYQKLRDMLQKHASLKNKS